MIDQNELLIKIKERIPCTCDSAYTSRKLTAPDCPQCNWAEEMIDVVLTHLTSHQPQCQMRWRSGKDLPPIDDSDFPRKYVCRFKGDDPRSGWVDVSIMTAAEMREENYDDYWEWLDEQSLSSSPAEDKVQILVEALETISAGMNSGGQQRIIATKALNKFKTP